FCLFGCASPRGCRPLRTLSATLSAWEPAAKCRGLQHGGLSQTACRTTSGSSPVHRFQATLCASAEFRCPMPIRPYPAESLAPANSQQPDSVRTSLPCNLSPNVNMLRCGLRCRQSRFPPLTRVVSWFVVPSRRSARWLAASARWRSCSMVRYVVVTPYLVSVSSLAPKGSGQSSMLSSPSETMVCPVTRSLILGPDLPVHDRRVRPGHDVNNGFLELDGRKHRVGVNKLRNLYVRLAHVGDCVVEGVLKRGRPIG